ncbi:MAG: NADH-quinone oxidoreductase subunit NuoF [Dehalococcoidales bacterium]|nr:NADH-quinone oxidoreductase subunit NuoF [Dehalococcoidales bacterium]
MAKRKTAASANGQREVLICRGSGCPGSDQILQRLKKETAGLGLKIKIKPTGCHGFCQQGPTVIIEPDGTFYTHVDVDDVAEIVSSHLRRNKPVERLFYHDPVTGEAIPQYSDVKFYQEQERIILRNCGHINPERIQDYIDRGGYQSLRKAIFDSTPEAVIDEVKRSGLRGRGGAGFPTGVKWETCRNNPGSIKYAICNADEGDPGAFMDRSVLESDPHAVLEGLAIAAYAIGSSEGYIYVRTEYPLAVKRLHTALAQAMENNYLGKNILGSDFSFNVQIMEGAGAFVCGEETALIASIESKRGMPRPRPPFPPESGLDGKPTIINNVKTLATIPVIMEKGADWYSTIGTEKSRGTTVFALTGKIANSGLVEVPLGTPLSKVIYQIGGGIPRGRQLKAVQTGGPSGGCIPARLVDSPIDYESLAKLGSIVGSGGMVVMDETTCMVEIARYFLSFTQSESCGKCTPCRLGTRQMLEILTRITEGKGRDDDIDTLLSIAETVKDCSLCSLGKTAPNPVISTINYFRDEYEAHIREKKCPAAVCEALMISPCQHTCPAGINIPKYVAYIADGNYKAAIETIRERNPFAAVCGRICHHPCEERCRRGELDDPVAIRSLKRFAADWYAEHSNEIDDIKPFPQTKKQKVAVVGAGPSGLACAYFLAQSGYGVTVYEALPVGGGMLSVAIPEFRLPQSAIQQDIDYIVKRGVEIKYNTPINTNYTVEHLLKDGFSAVFIAAGAQRSQRLGIPGEVEDIEGIFYGLRFLRDIRLGRSTKVGRRVAVIGGGNVALDAARTSLRLGAEEVNIYYRRSRDEMPVSDIEYDEAVDEGVKINFLATPTRVTSTDWKVTGLQCTRMELGEPDESGRRRPVPIPGSEFTIEADNIIAAVGQAPDLSFLPPDSELERTRWETLVTDSNTLATNIPGIFAGGDFVTGPDMVVNAIAAGRRSALAIDKYLRGDTSRVEVHDRKIGAAEERPAELDEIWETKPRTKVKTLPLPERRSSFAEIELGMSEEIARREAKRCLRCDLEG